MAMTECISSKIYSAQSVVNVELSSLQPHYRYQPVSPLTATQNQFNAKREAQVFSASVHIRFWIFVALTVLSVVMSLLGVIYERLEISIFGAFLLSSGLLCAGSWIGRAIGEKEV